MRARSLVGAATLAIGATAGAAAYVVARVQGRARGDVEDYLAGRVSADAPVVCLGASIVRGKASVDFVQMLRERLPHRTFVNAGVNGNVAWEVLQRLDDVIACVPGEVVVLVGTNDIQATMDPAAGESARRSKGLPETPSLRWYEECLAQVVRRLRDAGADVALCSLPPLGQDLEDAANARVREFNAAIARVAEAQGATYLPVYERLATLLASQGADAGPAWTGSWEPGVRSLAEHFLLGRSFDEVAARAGFVLSPDGVHLDTTGAAIVADLAAEFLSGDDPVGD